ncbi:MAG: aminopeptidase, partial [Crocinitomicaceae bacterium]
MKLLEELVSIRSAASDESKMAEFIKNYVTSNSSNWKVQPKIVSGNGFQDCVILVFGDPRTAIYAHIDSIGFSTGYDKELIKVGGPRLIDGMQLVGSDSQGEIETELMLIESVDGEISIQYVFDREIDRGTLLTFKP